RARDLLVILQRTYQRRRPWDHNHGIDARTFQVEHLENKEKSYERRCVWLLRPCSLRSRMQPCPFRETRRHYFLSVVSADSFERRSALLLTVHAGSRSGAIERHMA